MEGGLLHEIFYRSTQILTVVPVVTMILALNVKKSYAANQARYAADIATYPTLTASCKQTWLYDDSETDFEAFNFMDNATHSRQLYMYATAMLSLWASSYANQQIEKDFLRGREWYDYQKSLEEAANAEEESAAAESTDATDAADTAFWNGQSEWKLGDERQIKSYEEIMRAWSLYYIK